MEEEQSTGIEFYIQHDDEWVDRIYRRIGMKSP